MIVVHNFDKYISRILRVPLFALVCFFISSSSGFAEELLRYQDPDGRFSFEYSPAWGEVSKGTDSGFKDRVAAVRFTEFSSGMRDGKFFLGGEAVVTKRQVQVDIQALGGLYDPVSNQVIQPPMTKLIAKHLPRLSLDNFCAQLGKENHIDWTHADFTHLNAATINTFKTLDQTRNLAPEVVRCENLGDTAFFHKEATVKLGRVQNRQHLYGAVRFLDGRYSSFQIVRGALEPPSAGLLKKMADFVISFEGKD